ncbi:MAG: WD40/YVTN/BNR-like repeat-containing protein [Chitinophagaceae bacterium]
MVRIVALAVFIFIHSCGWAQSGKLALEILHDSSKVSLRGLSVVNDNIIWVSGSRGTIGRSVNAGKNWKWVTVTGFEKSEFRDIEAFDGNNAVIMAVGSPAYILKTNDGGDTWKIVFEDRRPEMFLDAMDFCNFQKGMVIGDPISGKPFVAITDDSGNSWRELAPADHGMAVDSGEAFFAASGSNLRYFLNGEYYLVSGGTKSRLLEKNKTTSLNLLQGRESTGANAIDVYDNGMPSRPGKRMVIVGGDFSADSVSTGNCLYTDDGGKNWKTPTRPPAGYRSGVEYISKKELISCGLNGVDYSDDGGRTWSPVSELGFHVVKIARVGTSVFLAGNQGRIARLVVRHL